MTGATASAATSLGPWERVGHRQIARRIGGRAQTICEVWSGGAESLEEADRIEVLIAAAPDLLNGIAEAAGLLAGAADICDKLDQGKVATMLRERQLGLMQLLVKATVLAKASP